MPSPPPAPLVREPALPGMPEQGVDHEWWDRTWLPRRPLATDDFLHGVYRLPRGKAKSRRYVEANPQALSNLLVVDVDHSDAALRLLWDRDGWRPNVVVESPATGRAHAVWALDEAITRTEYARRAPIRYGARVIEGLRRSVDGDNGYSGLLTKNPVHRTWTTRVVHRHLYTLGQLDERLADHGFMPPAKMLEQRRWRTDPTGLGRNEALFASARRWAYREIRHHWGDPTGLGVAIEFETSARNSAFTEPLPTSEMRGIASSITRWITTRSRMWADGPAVYDATFTTIQAARGRKGGRARSSESIAKSVAAAGRARGAQLSEAAVQLRSTAAGLLLS